MRAFTRHDILESLSESTTRPANCKWSPDTDTFLSDLSALAYALFNTSASVAKMIDNGLLAHIGAHGEPPLGLNYHAEMAFTKSGGLSNYEARNSHLTITRHLSDHDR